MEDEGDHRSGLVTRVLGRVFGIPRSLLGRLGGRLMALEHAGIYPLVVGALDLRPADRVLEIGSGSGAAAAMVAKRVTHGFIAASDPSPVMAV